jgi:hypothetical protein
LHGEGNRLEGVVALLIKEAVAGGEAAECAGDPVGGMGDVVEGQDPVVVSGGQQSGFGEGEGAKGGGGLAAAGRALKDKDGVGTRGAESSEEPGEAAEPVRGVGEIQEGAQEVEGAGFRLAVGAGFEDAEGGAP